MPKLPNGGEWTNTGGENDGTWDGQSGQNAGQLPSGEFVENNTHKRPASLKDGGTWEEFDRYIYETYNLRYFNNGIGKTIEGMQGTGQNAIATRDIEANSIRIFEWRKSYSSSTSTNKMLNVVLETFLFMCEGDEDVAFALWSWIDAKYINGSANSDDFGFRDVTWSNGSGTITMNGINIRVDNSVPGETTYYFG